LSTAFMLTSGRFQARLRWIDSGVVPMRLLIPQGGNSHLVSWPQARRASAKGVLAWLINLCCCRILPSAHSYLRAVLHPPAARIGCSPKYAVRCLRGLRAKARIAAL